MKKNLITISVIAIAAAFSLWYAIQLNRQQEFAGSNTFGGNGCDYVIGNNCVVGSQFSLSGDFHAGGGTFTYDGISCKDDQTIEENFIGLLYCSNE